jgi:DNA polymerase-1
MPTLFLIDGHSQMYRAYHAIKSLTGPDGRPTNAVYGFVAMLRRLLADHAPSHIATAFDLEGPTFRSELSAEYKANRAPMPPDLVEQVPWVRRASEALGVPVLTSEGFEADDVIGTLARRAAESGFDVAIVTGDKDLLQLVGGSIRVFNPRDDGAWFDAAGVVEKLGVPPDRVVDLLGLMGDAVDNIRGVPGIGEKGARDLIGQYGSLDALLAAAADVPQKRYREALLANAPEALKSRELARIRTDVPLDVELDALRYRGAEREACYQLFVELGFRSLTSEFAPSAATSRSSYSVVESMDELASIVEEARAAGRFGLKTIADDPQPMRAHIVGFAIATSPQRAYYVPVGHRMLDGASNLDLAGVLRHLSPMLADQNVKKIGHDLKADLVVLARHGVVLRGPIVDSMIASYLIDVTRAPHALETLASEHLGYRAASADDVFGRGSKASGPADVPGGSLLTFAAERADLPLRLCDLLEATLAEMGLADLYRQMEMPLLPVLADIELAGVRIDTDALGGLSRRLDQEMAARSARIFELGGGEFNINSPKQLSEVLFERLKLPAGRKTGKTRVASTSVDVLEELALFHELPRLILEWRGMQKLKGTYVDALPQLVLPATLRVHTSFNQAVAATGRLSSSDPNLQNIPVRTELGREIRQAFVAEPGSVLISADYSQIELRVLAHLSGDATLIEAFRQGEDIHEQTALKIFGPSSGIDPHELRRRAKMVNYALLYGKTAFSLSKDIGVTQQAAQEFIDAYFAGFPGVRTYIDQTLADARTSGFVRTLFGRRRPVPELTSKNMQVRSATERMAVNMPIQGTAADILKRAMIDVDRALAARPAHPSRARPRMILTVHDELLFEVAREDADEIVALVKGLMEGAAELSVPLTVEVGVGDNWKAAKD